MKKSKLALGIAPYKATETGELYYKVMGKTSSQLVFIGNDGKTESKDIPKSLDFLSAGDIVYIDKDLNIIKVSDTVATTKRTTITNHTRAGSMTLNKLSTM